MIMKIKDCLKCNTEKELKEEDLEDLEEIIDEIDEEKRKEEKMEYYDELDELRVMGRELRNELMNFRKDVNVAIESILMNPEDRYIPIMCSGLSKLVNEDMITINSYKQKINAKTPIIEAKRWKLAIEKIE